MRRTWRTALAVAFGPLALLAAAGTDGSLGEAQRLAADGAPIDVGVGHAAPWVCDWDGDGLPDLLVGQMGGGQLRIYRNVGSAAAPRFEGHTTFQAGGADATVPAG